MGLPQHTAIASTLITSNDSKVKFYIASFPGHSQILSHSCVFSTAKIWEWPGNEASKMVHHYNLGMWVSMSKKIFLNRFNRGHCTTDEYKSLTVSEVEGLKYRLSLVSGKT